MSILSVLPYIQIALAVLLAGGILLQRSEAGLGGSFGGDSFGGTQYERRGAEKTLFRATIGIAILFALSTFIGVLFQ